MAGKSPSMAPAVVAALLVASFGAHLAPRAAAQTCVASMIDGYDVSVPLGDTLILHWMTPTSTTLNLLLETTATGWAAVGWSADGRMAGSDAVVGNTGNPATVQAYTLNNNSLPPFPRPSLPPSLPPSPQTTPAPSLILHWKTPTSTTLNLLLETTALGWAAVGWSADGRMVGSDAVVGNTGNPPTVQAYALNSKLPGGQNPATSFEVGDTSVTENGVSTYIK
ncbi:unnamed protein product [Closterium sp. Naga37s-1]|nr:unnamed protein product [Closterium sp. Naga37s-1]